MAANASDASAAIGELAKELSANPVAATAAHAATCHRRSPVRSECAATVIMPAAATVNGIADHKPTAISDALDSRFTICGRKKLNPYPLVTMRNSTSARR